MSSILSRTLSCSLSVTVCSCIGLGLGIGFREWVPIRNIGLIGGSAGAHIPMRFGLQLSACYTQPISSQVQVNNFEVQLSTPHHNQISAI